VSLADFRTDAVILACAISAGIHAALAPEHFHEATVAGLGFVAATALLAVLAMALTLWPTKALASAGAAVVLAGLIGSYALAAATGVPVMHPEAEPVDGLALVTKAIEAVGLVAASTSLRRRTSGLTPQPKGS
jgi:hypothetical protein